MFLTFPSEIANFLSEEECKLVIHLAKLKGLQESQIMPSDLQQEAIDEMDISKEEIFNLLDYNQDGQLQMTEVHWIAWEYFLGIVVLVIEK